MPPSSKPSKRPAARKTAKSSAKSSDAVNPQIKQLKQLVGILERSTLSELSYEDSDVKVTLRRSASGAAPEVHAAPMVVSEPPPAAVVEAPAPAADDNLHVIRSPFVGTFYRSSSPDSAPFTDIDKQVRTGQTVCIVEAMKLMNEIECEIDGKIVDILVSNAQPVQYGDALFSVRAD